jgi:hypothetical protein
MTGVRAGTHGKRDGEGREGFCGSLRFTGAVKHGLGPARHRGILDVEEAADALGVDGPG